MSQRVLFSPYKYLFSTFPINSYTFMCRGVVLMEVERQQSKGNGFCENVYSVGLVGLINDQYHNIESDL